MSAMPGFEHFVVHPRFGRGPRISGLNVEPTGAPDVFLHWHSPADVRVPNTAIKARVGLQKPSTLPVTHYFDSRRVCRSCKRPFLFFAEEQQHWYEELKFPLEADCVKCVDCRKEEHLLRAARDRYEALLSNPDRSVEETLLLAESCLQLVEASVFTEKALPRIRALLKPLAAGHQGSGREAAAQLLERARTVRHSDDA